MVYLTGAGPGDIELLTLKALRVIIQADVIIYDKLINIEILKYAKDGCRFVYVGKSRGNHTLPQDQINKTIYEESQKSDTVVRLKGGDPLLFGRGSEEGIYLKSRGVEYEFIPGITSAIAAPMSAHIPVTHRGIAVSFRVITGHESLDKHKVQVDWQSCATDETLIFLMGLHRLKNIVDNLREIGKAAQTPCAIISRATLSDQEVLISTLDEICEIVATNRPKTPALIVVGKTVGLRDLLI